MEEPSGEEDRELSTGRSSGVDLVALEQTCKILAKCDSVPKVNELRIQAESLASFARKAREGLELVNKCAEVMIRAERRAGELLMSMNLQGGDRVSMKRDDRVTLEKLGISRYQACRWRKLAAIPDAVLEDAFRSANERKSELSTAALLRFAKSHDRSTVVDADSSTSENPPVNGRKRRKTPVDILDDLEGHCATLCGILLPLLESEESVTFKTVEKRYVKRLLSDSKEFLDELRERICPKRD